MAARVEKRGGMIIFGFKKLPEVQPFPFSFEGIKAAIKCLEDK